MKPKYSILIVEPAEVIVEGLKTILGQRDAFNIMASVHDATGLAERIVVLQPDVLILNPTLLSVPERMHVVQLQQSRPSMVIVALVYQYVEPQLIKSFRWVIDIRDSRGAIVSLLTECITSASADVESAENYELSERETDVLILVAQGCSSKEIADRLNISIHTVNSHRKNITHKTGIKSVAGLAVFAMLHNLT